MKYNWSTTFSSLSLWKTTFSACKEEHELVEWVCSQISHTSTVFNGNYFNRFFFLHCGKNTATIFSNSICFHFDCRVSIWADNVLRISVLKLSSRFPISAFITPPQEVFNDWIPCPLLASPREQWMHNSQIVSKSSLETSPYPTMFRSCSESSLSA